MTLYIIIYIVEYLIIFTNFVKLTKLEESASSKEDLEEKMTAIDAQLNVLRKTLNFICKHTAGEL